MGLNEACVWGQGGMRGTVFALLRRRVSDIPTFPCILTTREARLGVSGVSGDIDASSDRIAALTGVSKGIRDDRRAARKAGEETSTTRRGRIGLRVGQPS